jgi:hypothetical protein
VLTFPFWSTPPISDPYEARPRGPTGWWEPGGVVEGCTETEREHIEQAVQAGDEEAGAAEEAAHTPFA